MVTGYRLRALNVGGTNFGFDLIVDIKRMKGIVMCIDIQVNGVGRHAHEL